MQWRSAKTEEKSNRSETNNDSVSWVEWTQTGSSPSPAASTKSRNIFFFPLVLLQSRDIQILHVASHYKLVLIWNPLKSFTIFSDTRQVRTRDSRSLGSVPSSSNLFLFFFCFMSSFVASLRPLNFSFLLWFLRCAPFFELLFNPSSFYHSSFAFLPFHRLRTAFTGVGVSSLLRLYFLLFRLSFFFISFDL